MARTESRARIEEGLYAELAESRHSNPAAVRAAVGGGGQIDSLEGVELVVAAEVRYGVTVEDDELTRVCTSIPRLAELVASKMATAASTNPAGR